MRSRVGVGIVPPKVLGAPKPTSSVMMSRMFGAPFGGITLGGHHGVDWVALVPMPPPNRGAGEGRCLVSSVVVAFGDPGAADDPPSPWRAITPTVRGVLLHATQPATAASDNRQKTLARAPAFAIGRLRWRIWRVQEHSRH